MTREEAIEVYRGLINTKIKEAFEFFAPELVESEDERIINAIIGILMNSNAIDINVSQEKMLAWLEKQKEQKPVEWKPQPESLEALMYAIEGKWDMIPPTSYLSRRLEDLYEGLVNTYHVDESLITELHKVVSEEDIEALRELKRKIDASMDKNPVEWSEEDEKILDSLIRLYSKECSVNAWPWANGAFTYGDVVNFLKSLRPQQKDDFDSLQKDFRSHNEAFEAGREFERSRKPQWKPSEEQIHAIIEALKYLPNNKDEWRVLNTLVDVFRKLM